MWFIGIVIVLNLNSCTDRSLFQKSPSEKEKPLYTVEDQITTNKFAIRIDRVEVRRSVGNAFFQSNAALGGIYVVVNYSYKNISSKPINAFKLPTITLLSPDGARYEPDLKASTSYATEIQLNKKILSDLNPSIQTRAADVFEINEDMYNQGIWEILVDADEDFTVNINTAKPKALTSQQSQQQISVNQLQEPQRITQSGALSLPPGLIKHGPSQEQQSAQTSASNYEYSSSIGYSTEITMIQHPKGEPPGLYVVDFNVDDVSYTYRIYCPTKMVRNISNNQWRKDNYFREENNKEFNGEPILTGVIDEMCNKYQ